MKTTDAAEYELKLKETEARITKMLEETHKIIAETRKINTDRVWVPVAATAGIVVAIMTVLDRLIA